MQIAFIDHNDSFSYNVLHWLEQCGFSEVQHIMFDKIPEEVSVPIVLSPGPHDPSHYPKTIEFVKKSLGQVPILGICLGHQILGAIAGCSLKRSQLTWHGKTRIVNCLHASLSAANVGDLQRTKSGFLKNCPDQLSMASYNSLYLDAANIFNDWQVTATNEVNEVEVIECWKNPLAPAIGLQFHPESFLSDVTNSCLQKNWYEIVKGCS